MNENIGVDTLKIWVPEYRLKQNTLVNLSRSENKPDRNKKAVLFDNGKYANYESLRFESEDKSLIVNFKQTGGLTAQMNVPKTQNQNNIEMMDCSANQKTYDYIFDRLNDSGVLFDPKIAQNSRIDLTRNLDLSHNISEYYPLMSMMPYEKENFIIGSTKYQRNKSFVMCAYDKIQECIDKKQIIPDEFKGKNIGRIENRWMNGGKLRNDSKKAGVNLLSMDSMTDPDKFRKVQNLYLSYMQRLFRYDYKMLIENKKGKMIQQIKNVHESGLSPLKTLAYSSNAFQLLSIDEIAFIFYPSGKNSKQARYRFRKRCESIIKTVAASKGCINIEFDAMYSEIRTKALQKVA